MSKVFFLSFFIFSQKDLFVSESFWIFANDLAKIERPMKKFIFITCLVLTAFMLPTSADAQVKLGLKFGANMSKSSFNNHFFDKENQVGFLIGPMLDIKIPILGIGLDLAVQYNNKKVQFETDDVQLSQYRGYATLQNIEVPMNLKWTLGNDKIFSVYGATGPQFSWNINDQSLKQIFETDQYTMRNSAFSWNVGAGFTFLRKLRLGYTYNIGIGETAKIKFEDGYGNLIDSRLKSNTHQFFVTYFF